MTSLITDTEKIILSKVVAKVRPESKWYVLYTFPKAEKAVYSELVKRNYEVFFPTIRTLNIWRNRQKKWIDRALFPNYVFVYTLQRELYYVTRVPKVVNYIEFEGKPSVISLKEVECIKKMLSLKEEIQITTEFFEGEKVRIISGPLAGYDGTLVDYKGKVRFGIQLNEINHSLLINISSRMLEKI